MVYLGRIMNEAAMVLYRNHLIAASEGTPASVEFPFEKIWDFKRKQPLFNPSYLRFYHTHPPNFLQYSATDENCLKGLNLAFDFPVYFSIINFTEDFQISYIFYKRMIEVEDIPLSKENLYLLKYLSNK